MDVTRLGTLLVAGMIQAADTNMAPEECVRKAKALFDAFHAQHGDGILTPQQRAEHLAKAGK